MTPDQFAAWLVEHGIPEFGAKYSPEPTPDGPRFLRQVYDDDNDRSDVLFYVNCARYAVGLLSVYPIVWIGATEKWRLYDGTDHYYADPVSLLRQELTRQAARCEQMTGLWFKLHTEVLGLDRLIQSEPDDSTSAADPGARDKEAE